MKMKAYKFSNTAVTSYGQRGTSFQIIVYIKENILMNLIFP